MEKGCCPLCEGSPTEERFHAREMMFGLRETFVYRQCADCGSLWLAEIPDDMSRFYAGGYYSLQPSPIREVSHARVKAAVVSVLLKLPPRIVERSLVARDRVPTFVGWLAGTGTPRSAPIADVGCGEGRLLRQMARFGFSNLWGFDPYLAANTDEGAVHLRAHGVQEMSGKFKLIMLHHSFEHMDDPFNVLTTLRHHLTKPGTVLIRVPVADTLAWQTYGADWVGLDAPRHLFIPSVEGMDAVARRSGYAIERIFFDSYALQFWGSEKYKRDIPLGSPEPIHSEAQMKEWEALSEALNAQGEGDSAGFVLTSVNST